MAPLNYNRRQIVGLALAAVVTLAAALTGQDRPLALTNGDSLTATDFIDGYPPFLEASGRRDDLATRLLYLQHLWRANNFIRYGHAAGLANEPDIRLMAFLTWRDMLADQVGRRLFLERVSNTPAALEETYRFNETALHTRAIHLPDSLTALKVLGQLQAGIRFENLALRFSASTGLLDRPWEMGWTHPRQLDPAYARAASDLKIGAISGPVRTTRGFAIIQLLGKNFSPDHGHFERIKRQQVIMEQIGEQVDLAQVYSELRLWVAQQNVKWRKSILRKVVKNRLLAQPDPEAAALALDPKLIRRSLFSINGTPVTLRWVIDRLALLPPDFDLAPVQLPAAQDLLMELLMMDRLMLLVESLPEGEYWLMAAEAAATDAIDRAVQGRITDRIISQGLPSDDALLQLWSADSARYYQPAMIDMEEIVVADSHLASDLQWRLLQGGGLALLAAEHTIREWARQLKGRLGWIPADLYGPWADSLLSTQPGTVVGPERVGDLYFIARIWDSRPAQWLEQAELLPRLRERWHQTYRDSTLDSWLAAEGLRFNPTIIDTVQLMQLNWPDEGLAPLASNDPDQLP